MELTWKLGERRIGKIFGDRDLHRERPNERGISFSGAGTFPRDNEPSVDTVTFTVMTKSDDTYYDWYVRTVGNLSFGVCEEWGAVLEGADRALDKSVPFGVGQHRMMKVSGIHWEAPVEVRIRSASSGGLWYASCVSCGSPDHYEKYWGIFEGEDDRGAIAGGPAFSVPAYSLTGDIMEPVVGQLRRMTVPHIHGKAQVIIRVDHVRDGKVDAASCVQCPSDWHKDSCDQWTMVEAEDFGVVDMLTEQAAAKQPKQETTMEIEARKAWALAQDWTTHVPKKMIKYTSNMAKPPMAGEIWAYNDGSNTAVVLSVGDGEAIVLAGSLCAKGVPERFSHNGGRQNHGALLRTASDDTLSLGIQLTTGNWKKDPVAYDKTTSARTRYPIGSVWELTAKQDFNASRGDLLMVTEVGDSTVSVVNHNGRITKHGTGLDVCATRMCPLVGGRAVVTHADVAFPCGNRSTAYGLTCTLNAGHDGDTHTHVASGAKWEKKDVIKLDACWYECKDAAGAAALSVGTARVVATGQTKALCLKCMNENEAAIARRMGEHDRDNPQPRRQERFMVESHTLEAGGVFGIGR